MRRRVEGYVEKYGPDCVIPAEQLFRLIETQLEKHPVMAPRERSGMPGFYRFEWLRDAGSFVPDYTATTLPPKKAFFEPDERLFHFESDSHVGIRNAWEDFPFILAGVHPCDLAALEALDAAYLHPPAEIRWEHNRKRASIIGIDCMPDEYCFCTSVGAWDARYPSDIFLTHIGNNYLVETFTSKGEKLLESVSKRDATNRDREKVQRQRLRKKEAVSAGFNATVSVLADILEKKSLTNVWKEIAGRCYSCGSCNTTCPTCFCFNMHDTFDFSLKRGIRHRTWDSCQLLEFALIAGGENMRPERWQRVRHRWNRKFLYLYRQFGRPYCTGCGRCSRACTADINIVDVTNRIIEASRKGDAK
ncbi:MAG: 4Fe-4S dicluster domain-containing protein [Desulfobacterales bacterium]